MNTYDITFYNTLTECRAPLIKGVDGETAKRILTKFGSTDDPAYYLLDPRAELVLDEIVNAGDAP